jgi:transposase
MLSWPPTVRIFLSTGPTDMRKGFDGLAEVVRSALGLDPLSGHLYVFRNRRGDRIKVLYWDRDGLAYWYKRLERGTFRFPAAGTAGTANGVEVKAADLMMILDGVDLGSVRRQRRYSRETVANPGWYEITGSSAQNPGGL